jgi:restriction system protein
MQIWQGKAGGVRMTVWMVRAGKDGAQEEMALAEGLAVIGWSELPDLSPITTRAALREALSAAYPEEKAKTLSNWESQIWPLRDTIQDGDLVVLPLKTRADIAIGRVTGPYAYRTDLPKGPYHTRPVDWLKELPRNAFDQDLLYSLGAFMTVCRIERNNAEGRIKALLDGKPLPPPVPVLSGVAPAGGAPEAGDSGTLPDLQQQSEDLLRQRIAQRFKGHGLTHLVAAILEAQGYRVRTGRPGADGGVDITAGSGPLGFEAPRLVVQVKSEDAKIDVKVLRELTGVMAKFHAEHALLVGWGGFTTAAIAEAAADYFKVRLWDAGDVVRAVQQHYDRLPEGIRAEMPLKQVWILVPGESEK